MSTENNPANDTYPDNWMEQLYGQTESQPEPEDTAMSEEAEEEVESALENTDDDTQLAEEPQTEDIEEQEKPRSKKKSVEERISELTGKFRAAERERDALMARLAEVENKKTPAPEAEAPPATNSEPNPDDKNQDGSDKYPLGEYDKNYLADVTKYNFEKLMAEKEATEKEAQDRRKAEEELSKAELAQQAALEEWNEKLIPARERYPDYVEKGQEMIESLGNLDEQYGKYLQEVIMSLDNGTDVFYHLASNPTAAKQIIDMGPTKATIALGRIDAMFASNTEEPAPKIKVSRAPTPPPVVKGVSVSKTKVTPDTDDYASFRRQFGFDKR